MLPCCIECPFHDIQAVHLENRIVLVGTIQAQIFGHHGRGDSAIVRGEIIDYRFAAEISEPVPANIGLRPDQESRGPNRLRLWRTWGLLLSDVAVRPGVFC